MSSDYRSGGAGLYWLLAVIILVVIVFLIAQAGAAADCRDAGGEWVSRYKQTGICLAPGSVVHP